jgi:predicted phosphodiesterase
MRRVAALYDIHSNPFALEAVLQDVRRAGVDQIVVGGDVFPGPMPRETLAHLLELDIPTQFIYGNCERALLALMTGADTSNIPEQLRVLDHWVAGQLDPEHEALIASWPMTLRIGIDGVGDVLFCHATPRDENEIFTRLTAESKLLPIFAGLGVSVVVCGHTHMQFDRMVGSTRVVNAGSVGSPFGEPGAYWLLLGPDIEFRHTRYDVEKAVVRFQAIDYPQPEFAERYVLHPPSEDEMLEIYSKAELKSQ